MSQTPEYHVAVIGAGPRGVSFLERLLAHCERQARQKALTVHLIDPAPHGSGKVWDPEQSPLYLMNTPALFPTAAPVGGTQEELPASSVSWSFQDWAEKAGLGCEPSQFPARRDYGRYLQDLLQAVIAALRALGVTVTQHRQEVLALKRAPGPESREWSLILDSAEFLGADSVVLAMGHIPAQLDGAATTFAARAEAAGLHYLPPAVPTDVDMGQFPAAENVLIRGMGLNFFDLMIQLTVGRGGTFETVANAEPGHRLRYRPSGTEPNLIAGSRRGTPYRSKTTAPGFVPDGIELTHFTSAAVAELLEAREQANEQPQLHFADDLWPLIEADIKDTYDHYAAIANKKNRTPDGAEVATPQVTEQGTSPSSGSRFDIRAYARPFDGREFNSFAQYQEAMHQWLIADAATSVAGHGSPEKMAANAMHAARLALKPLITAGRMDPISQITQVEGWFESLVEGLTSGPPLQRIEELAALARAGIVQFLGPQPVFEVDAEAQCFTAKSAQVAGEPITAKWLIEAMMPPNRVAQADTPLVHQLFHDGLAQPAAGARPGKGFEVTGSPHRLVPLSAANPGGVAPSIYVLGLQLSSVQWGAAIAAEAGGDPRSTARTLADAHAAAAEVTRAAASKNSFEF